MAERLYEELGLNKREAKEIVELFFEEIRACLEGNEQVKLSGFGNFDLRDKSQRPGRNPKTGEEIPISARRVVTFRPGQKLKARVETYGEEQAAKLQDTNETRGDDSEPPQFGMRAFESGNEQQ
jgi:integration host factor subunit alpha